MGWIQPPITADALQTTSPVRAPHRHVFRVLHVTRSPTATLWLQNSILLGLGVHSPLCSCHTCFPEQMCVSVTGHLQEHLRGEGGRCHTGFPPDFKQHLGTHLTSFRFELVIVWRVQIDEEGKVLPKLDLLPKAPQQGTGPGGGGARTSHCA